MLGASDGDIGAVKDFYFDDQNRAVRYVVADTGKWLAGRQVLISPQAFKSSHPLLVLLPHESRDLANRFLCHAVIL